VNAQTNQRAGRARLIRLRQMLASNAELGRKMDSLEKKYDVQFKAMFDVIRQLKCPRRKPNAVRLVSM
jgi:Mor family transcriptional regulator